MKISSFFSILTFILVMTCAFVFVFDVYSTEQYVQIFGEHHRLLEYNGTVRTYEIDFSVRNNTDQNIVHFCYVPHLYNELGEIYQVSNPGVASQWCHLCEIPSKGVQKFTVQISDYSGIATRVNVESVFFMLSN